MSRFPSACAGFALLAVLAACGAVPTDPGLPGHTKASVPAEGHQAPSSADVRGPGTAHTVTPPVATKPPVVAQAPKSTGPAAPPDAKAAPKPSSGPAATPPAVKAPATAKPGVAPAAASTPAPGAAVAPALDLKGLEQRIKETEAIGLLTKLSIKNQVDELVGQFRTYHDGHRPPTLPELRRPFEMLLMKLLALLQDKDPGLAKALHESRDAIWGILADRERFSKTV